MDLPRERLLLMLVVLTGFAVLVGGWAGAFAHAQLGGLTEWVTRVAIGLVFLLVVVLFWVGFTRIDRKRD